MNFHVWNKISDKISRMMFISSRIFRKVHPIEHSWVITHECSSIKYEYCAQLLCQVHYTYFPIPLCQMVQGTIWLFCKIHFTWFVKFALPSHRVNTAQLSSPCCQVSIPKVWLHINKAILPNCEVQIHFVNCPNEPPHKKFLGCPMP